MKRYKKNKKKKKRGEGERGGQEGKENKLQDEGGLTIYHVRLNAPKVTIKTNIGTYYLLYFQT